MNSQQLHISVSHDELSQKLHTILQTLQHEQAQIRSFYSCKISHMEIEMDEKQKELDRLRLQIIGLEDRCQKYQENIFDKNKVIEELNTKVMRMQDFVKEKLYCFIDEFDLSCTSIDSPHKETSTTWLQQSGYQKYMQKQQQIKNKINISEYFIKSIQNSQVSTKIKTNQGFDTPSQHSNSVSHLKNKNKYFNNLKDEFKIQSEPYLSVSVYANSTHKLEKVKSLDQFRKKSQWNSQVNKNEKKNTNYVKQSQNYNQFQYSKKTSLNSQQYLLIHSAQKQMQIKRKKQQQTSATEQKNSQKQKQKVIPKQKLKILAMENKHSTKYSPKHNQFMQKWKKVSAFQEPHSQKYM